MAYDTSQLRLVTAGLSQGRNRVWVLDTTDALTAAGVFASGYISDAVAKGVGYGDEIVVRRWSDTADRTTGMLGEAKAYVSTLSSTAATLTSVATFATPVFLPIYAVAGVPAATAYTGAVIYTSNGASGTAMLAYSNGTNWLRADTFGTITAT